MRLEINYRGKNVKNTNTWRLNTTLLNNQEITEEIKEEIKKYLETITMKTQWSKTYGMQQNSSKREVYSNTSLPQETRQMTNKQSNYTPKGTRERRIKKT